ncbi:MAG: fructose-bisphosphatase class III [Planctomycetes bacterium]|nr:fructose-bisphosphatase class III [Planctomycetota bacterium]
MEPAPNNAILKTLARELPNLDYCLAELARLTARLDLPKGVIHVMSDIHGDDVKLRHVINNASGTLRPIVERLFSDHADKGLVQEILSLLFYPHETMEDFRKTLPSEADFDQKLLGHLGHLLRLVREIAGGLPVDRLKALCPAEYRPLLLELVATGAGNPSAERFAENALKTLARHDRCSHVVRVMARLVRNLAVDEIIIAGDCWDRGPRGDRVVDILMQQPNLAFTWGNHDTAWLGACLGHEACIAHVLRLSMRYRRLAQLEEGYGIPLLPLQLLVEECYANDPVECFKPKGTDLHDATLVARMQKAAAIMQFKLEGQMISRHPEWNLDSWKILAGIDPVEGTVAIGDKKYPLRDRHFPTLRADAPYELHPAEKACMARMREHFLASRKLWQHVVFLRNRGSMYLTRDKHVIFHGCVPVDSRGEFLAFPVDGAMRQGRYLLEAMDAVIARVVDHPAQTDLDMCWYLWCGPLSPLFGKDRICTFQNDFIADPLTHVETKNPYFSLIHESWFCDKILAEFGIADGNGLLVNGHVPVKIEKGESPIKKSGKAITIDGAFSEAYGDHGYTLVLEPARTLLATHHHFESVSAAVHSGTDIIPKVTTVKDWGAVRKVGDTEAGKEIVERCSLIEQLAQAYKTNRIRQDYSGPAT